MDRVAHPDLADVLVGLGGAHLQLPVERALAGRKGESGLRSNLARELRHPRLESIGRYRFVHQPDAHGDRIRHGAIDNATGVAAVLELARVFAAGPRPERSLLFMALTAEEKGLQGASYFAANPLVPLEKTAAVINVEMLSPDGPNHDIASWGNGRVSLEQDLERVAEARGRRYSPDPNLEAGFFYRADHFAFARAGVPAITAGAGLDQVEGGVERGKALREAVDQRTAELKDEEQATGAAR